MRRPATNILLLVVYCLCCHFQPTVAGPPKCKWAVHACAGGNRKRSGIDELTTNLRTGGEWPDIQETREGERRGGSEREGDGYRDSREGDDLRSEFNDRRPLLEGRQLLDIVNRRIPVRSDPLDSALSRLRSLLRTTELDVEDRKEEEQEEEEKEAQWQEEERSNTDTNRRYIGKDTQTMLRRILDDIERKQDPEPVSDSVSKKPGYSDDDTEDNQYSLKKRALDQ